MATTNQIIIAVHNETAASLGVAELAPYQAIEEVANAPEIAHTKRGRRFTIIIPRFDGPRDRLYSGFVVFKNVQRSAFDTNLVRMPIDGIHFVEYMRGISKYNEPFPRVASKKGLQVQMVDDAIALGVKHAALNLDLTRLIDLSNDTNNPSWQMDGVIYHFKRGQLQNLDDRIKPLSDAGMVVTVILLDYQSGNPALDRIMLHPDFSRDAPHHLSAFNTVTPEGLRYFKAAVEFVADRYSQPKHPHGRVVNFIVGNEVNTHWYWANLGNATMEKFAADYLRTVRICDIAVRKASSTARVYISLEHHWNIRFDTPEHSFAAREFIDYFSKSAQAGGDFDWNLAFHPYPEDLRNPRTWNDKTATFDPDTPRITFKNLEMLPRYFKRKELLYHRKPRHIILSEQGFDTPQTPDGELVQAAAYCYAYYKVARIPGIDSFILHRHVDHRDEDGLNLGLWRRNLKSTSPSEPAGKKYIYEVFRQADTPQWRKAFAFALPIIGIHDWKEINPKN
ncbi:MAG TPA: DUF5722 domain-containing protein [Verrucomicrobiae bacterium]|nr:DUF5722 domain-containing protein [Verrucomicrobiae bacterium]